MFSGFLPAPLAPRFKNTKMSFKFHYYKLIICVLH